MQRSGKVYNRRPASVTGVGWHGGAFSAWQSNPSLGARRATLQAGGDGRCRQSQAFCLASAHRAETSSRLPAPQMPHKHPKKAPEDTCPSSNRSSVMADGSSHTHSTDSLRGWAGAGLGVQGGVSGPVSTGREEWVMPCHHREYIHPFWNYFLREATNTSSDVWLLTRLRVTQCMQHWPPVTTA